MSEDVLREAIKKLEEDLEKLVFEVKKKRQAINVLYESMGEQPPYETDEEPRGRQPMRPDQFYGRSFTAAASEFLQMKKRACSADEILHGLEEGGFDFAWKEGDRLRNVAISLSKNSYMFEKLPNNTFGLLAWYPEKQTKRKKIAKIEQTEMAKNLNEENKEEEPK